MNAIEPSDGEEEGGGVWRVGTELNLLDDIRSLLIKNEWEKTQGEAGVKWKGSHNKELHMSDWVVEGTNLTKQIRVELIQP